MPVLTRKKAQQTIDQCELLSLLALSLNRERVRVKELDKETKKDCEAHIHIIKVAMKWANRGLNLVSANVVHVPCLVWNRQRFGNVKADVALEIVKNILNNPKPPILPTKPTKVYKPSDSPYTFSLNRAY